MFSLWKKTTNGMFGSGKSRKSRSAETYRPQMECLEERLALSWTGVPPASITPPSSYSAVTLNSAGDAQASASISSNEVDYYRFTARASGVYRIAASTPNSNVDTVLGVFTAGGQRIAYNDDISSSNYDSNLTVNLQAGTSYYFGITNYTGTGGGSYSWLVDGPAAPADDSYENNDTLGTAYNLGTLTSVRTITGLRMRDSADWFRFTQNAAGGSADYVAISFSHAEGDLDVGIYNSQGTLLRSSTGVSNSEHISLDGLAAGTYYVRVYGYNGAQSSNYSLAIDPGAATSSGDDAYEDNDSMGAAYNLGTLTGAQTISGLRMRDSGDWFRFTQNGVGGSSDFVSMSFSHAEGDLDVYLYNSQGTQVGYSNGVSNSEYISLNGLAAGTYYVHVYGYAGAQSSNYSLAIDPGAATSSGDDAYEDNDSMGAAYNLGTLTAVQTISGLRMRDSGDWFRFTQNGVGGSSDYVSMSFSHAEGDLDVALYDSQGTFLRSSTGVTNSEQISLDGLAAGTYYVRVYGYNGAQSSNYSLSIDPGSGSAPPPPPPPPPGTGDHILYLNFDAVNMSWSDLSRWAGTDWQSNLSNFCDPERDGIRVTSYMSGQSNREQVITQIINMVQADLTPFGITVQRRTGLAVENQGATTVFVGQDNINLQFGGIACDIDYGNNNRTDIAFARVTNSPAQSVADLILHEAGHTFGLYHVNSPNAREVMGMGYSSGTYTGMNVEFLNQSFSEYLDHGDGRGPQNSYQVMRNNFGSGTASASTAPHSHSGSGFHYHLADGTAVDLEHADGHDHSHGHDHGHDHHDGAGRPASHSTDMRDLAAFLAAIQANQRDRFAADALFARS